MPIERAQLPNGLRIYNDHMPGTRTSLVHVHVGSGGVEGGRRDAGKAHALEHSLHLGTQQFPDQMDLGRYAAYNMLATNAYTTKRQTAFHAHGPNAASIMYYLSEIVCRPTFPADAIDREMDVIQEERMSDTTFENAHDIASLYALFGEGVSRPTIGYADARFSPGELQKFWRKHYTAPNMAIVAVGACTLDELFPLAERYFGDLPDGSPNKVSVDKRPNILVDTASSGLILPISEYVYISDSVPIPTGIEAHFLTHDPAYLISLNAMSRYLYQVARMEHGLSYGSSVMLSEASRPGARALLAFTNTRSQNMVQVGEIHKKVFTVGADAYPEAILAGVQRDYVGELLRDSDDINGRSHWHMERLETGQEPVSVEESIARAEQTSIDGIKSAIDTIIDHTSAHSTHTHISGALRQLRKANTRRVYRQDEVL